MTSQDGALRLQYHFDLPFLNPTLLTGALLAPGVTTREGNKAFGLLGGTALQLYLQVEGLKREMSLGMSPPCDPSDPRRRYSS
jgi:hypothetical protein